MKWDEEIKGRLSELRLKLLGLRLVGGAFYALTAIAIMLLLAAFSEAIFRFEPDLRMPLLAVTIAICAVFLLIWILTPVLRYLLRPTSNEKLALLWGYSLPGINDRLLNALQVFENRQKEGSSPELAELALTTIAAEIKDSSFENALDRTPAKRALRWSGGMAGLWVVTLLISQGSLSGAISRIFQPNTDFRPAPPFALMLGTSPGFVIKGEPLDIEVGGTGDLPVIVTFHVQESGVKAELIDADFDSLNVARTTLIDPQDDLVFFAYSGDIFSDTASVSVKSRPFIKELEVRWFPPAYSKLPSGSSIGKRGDVAALKGSRVRVAVKADRIITEAELVIFSDENPYHPKKVVMEIQESGATADFRLLKSGHYNIIFQDQDGIQNAEPVDYSLWPILDEWPVISIFYPPPEAEFNETLLVPLKVGARDDFAISKFQLGRMLVKGGIEDTTTSPEFEWQEVPFETFEDGTALVDLLLDFNDLNQVYDNDVISGPKKAETSVQRLIFPTLEEIFARMEESYDAQFEDVRETLDRSYELREQLEALEEELKRNPDLSWEDRKNVEEMIKRQEEMAKQAEEMSERIDEMIQKMEENRLLTPETMEKFAELQQMMSEVMTPELMKAMQQLQDALKQQDPEKLRRAVEEFSLNQEEFLQKMEKTLNILKQLQMEMKLDELAKRAEKLLEKQQEINEALGDSSQAASDQELAQAESQLQREMEAFEQAFQEAQEMLAESPHNPEAEMNAAEQLLEEQQFPQSMNSMSQDLQQGSKPSAKQKGQQIEGGLAELSDMMQKAKESMVESAKSDLAEALKKISHDLLNLSYQQEDLLDRSGNLDKASPQFRTLAQEQQILKNHLEKTGEDLIELSQKSFFITPQIGAAMDRAFRGMDQALSGYTARAPRSVSRQQQSAMGGLNETVMQIGESLDQLNSSSSSTGFSEMMEQLAKMSGQQSDINQGTMSLLPGGTNPGQMTLEQQAAMSRLAGEQEALRQQMENWSEANQEMSKAMGRLGELAKEMQEVVDDLKTRQVDERTLKRQERILRRLLDAQKSVREREHRRERLSRTAEGLYFGRSHQQLIKSYFDALAREN
jgi:hypothetical protein